MLSIATVPLSAQKFLEPSFDFSEKKISYLTLEDDSEVQVYLRKLKYEKGLIEEIKVEGTDGKKVKISPEKIKFMYLPQSGFDKFVKAYDFIHDAQKWDNDKIDRGKVAEGYIYFEKAEVKIKKKTETLMMQLLNPSFSSKIKVYHDPYAKETAGIGIAGIKVAGGDDKSYYVAAHGAPAFKLIKKNYEEEFAALFDNCTVLNQKYADKIKWVDLETHVYEHSLDCN